MIQIILSIEFERVGRVVIQRSKWCIKSWCNLFGGFSGGYVCGVIWLGGFCKV
jgi:hypothetical protein